MYTECRASCKVCEAEIKEEKVNLDDDEDWINFKTRIRKLRFGEKLGLLDRQPDVAVTELLEAEQSLNLDDKVDKEKLGWILNYLGVIYLFGGGEDSPVPRDEDKAFEYFKRSAALGNIEGQFYVGYVYSLRDQKAMSLLYYYFAATGGSTSASLTLGFKHSYGIGVPKSCEGAIQYLADAAEQVVKNPHKAIRETTRLDAQDSGQDMSKMDQHEIENLLEYQEALADAGDFSAQIMLAQIYRRGVPPFIDPRPEQALNRLDQAIRRGNDNIRAQAHALLASMHMNGNGVPTNNDTAFEHMSKSAKIGNAEGMYGLAHLYHHGIGVEQDMKKAVEYYQKASDKGVAEAQFHLGMLYFSGVYVSRDYGNALKQFSKAAVQGYTQAIYYVAWMHRNGLATAKSCRMALQLFTVVAHKSSVAEIAQIARRFHKNDLYEESFAYYALAAELGFELAQYNAAYMAMRSEGVPEESSYKLAYRYYSYCADQGNSIAQRILGDFFYYLWEPVAKTTSVNESIPEESPHYKEAVYYYDLAAKNPNRPNAHAMWNMGYMHQYGLGRPKDFEIAKRYFDQARLMSDSAYVPSMISLAVLGAEYIWENWIMDFHERVSDGVSGRTGPTPWYLEAENIILVLASIGLIIVILIKQMRLGGF